jgi:hypothetical protein
MRAPRDSPAEHHPVLWLTGEFFTLFPLSEGLTKVGEIPFPPRGGRSGWGGGEMLQDYYGTIPAPVSR